MAKKKKKGFAGSKQTKSAVGDINVTPLIDIVLVLLIIYMVVTPVMIYQMRSNLPEKTEDATPDDMPTTQILLAACDDGSFMLNRRSYETLELIKNIRKLVIRKIKAGEQAMVFLDAHPNAEYDTVIKLMDVVKKAGNEIDLQIKVGLATLKQEQNFIACTPIDG